MTLSGKNKNIAIGALIGFILAWLWRNMGGKLAGVAG